jgi:hypothetical protein
MNSFMVSSATILSSWCDFAVWTCPSRNSAGSFDPSWQTWLSPHSPVDPLGRLLSFLDIDLMCVSVCVCRNS